VNPKPSPFAPSDLPDDPCLSYNSLPLHPSDSLFGTPETDQWDGPVPTIPVSTDHMPLTPSAPAAYVLNKLITVGGFGEIWEATQASLGRVVAIKRIRRDLLERTRDDVAMRRRYEIGFRQEAIIAGRLEHPNIVPIHDLGLEEEGFPLLAMKLVRGKPWDRLIADDFQMPIPAFLRKHLPILVAACQAMAFAHSRGILHRDLKPSQVMVGEFGEVQLMDWGIAVSMEDVRRSIQPGAPPGIVINPSGTAAFMAPEQTERSAVNLGPWTDVYLLGGTLYYLLTGRVPHGSNTANGAFYEASRGDVVPPQQRNPNRHVPPELGALAMKAMARHPVDRVPSAQAFLEQLEDYITGEGKRRESAALSIEVETQLAPSPKSYTILNECNSQLDRALILWPDNPHLEALRSRCRQLFAESALANNDLTLARMHASRLGEGPIRDALLEQVTAAEQKQALAAERLRQATLNSQDLLNFILLDLHSGLREIGRLDLLEKAALKVFAHFADFPETAQEAGASRNRTHALRNIADVLKEKARLEEGLAALRQAVRIAEDENRANPNDFNWIEDLSDSWDKMAALYYELGDLEAATKYNSRGLHLRERLCIEDESRADWRSRLAWSFHQQGVIRWRQGRQEEALADLEEAIRQRRLNLEEDESNFGEKAALAYAINGKVWVLRALGKLDEALADAELALKLRQELAARRPDSLACLGDVAWSLKSLGLLYEDRLEIEKALNAFSEAQKLCHRISGADPLNTSRRMELAFCHGGLGRNYHVLGKLAEAELEYRTATELHGPIVEQERSNGRDLRDHLYNLAGLSAVLLDLKRPADALVTAARGLRWGNALLERTRENPSFVEARARVLVQLGRAEAALGNQEAAKGYWTEAVDTMLPFFAEGEYPAVQEETLAVALLLLGRRAEAEKWLQRLMRKSWGSQEFLRLIAGGDIQ
jgi:serine/threonine protein kinase